MMMWGAFWKGGNREITRPVVMTWFKIKDVCILSNVIEIFLWKKITKTKRGRPFEIPHGLGRIV
jgi:hypothetical protein